MTIYDNSIAVVGNDALANSLAWVIADAGQRAVLVVPARRDAEAGLAREYRRQARFGLRDGGLPDFPRVRPRIHVETSLTAAAHSVGVLDCRRNATRERGSEYERLVPGVPLIACLGSNAAALREVGCSSLAPRLLAFHALYPVRGTTAVELFPTARTSTAAIEAAKALFARLGFEPFVFDEPHSSPLLRIALAAICEAMRFVDRGVLCADDVDRLARGCLRTRLGPLESADLIGLDTMLELLDGIAAEGESHFEPPALLRELVAAGETGNDSRNGFHVHAATPPGRHRPPAASVLQRVRDVVQSRLPERRLGEATELFAAGAGSSLTMLEIADLLEASFGVIFSEETLTRDNFGSIERIASHVTSALDAQP